MLNVKCLNWYYKSINWGKAVFGQFQINASYILYFCRTNIAQMHNTTGIYIYIFFFLKHFLATDPFSELTFRISNTFQLHTFLALASAMKELHDRKNYQC